MRMRSILLASLALLAAAGCASSRSLGESVDDLGANAKLKTVLLTDRNHDYGDVDLTIYEGRLLLTGTMPSEEGRRALIENAWKADTVDQVIDEIFVGDRTSLGQGLEDTRIDTAIKAKLVGDRGVRSSDFKIAVSGGVVYLLGRAPNAAALERAVNHARSTAGVSRVVSHVVLMDDPAARR